MSKATVKNYIQPRHPGTAEANRHHHPAQIRLAAVGRNEMSKHVNEHYCLSSVKGVKLFASAFSQDVILISQDDKAKVNYFLYSFFLINCFLKYIIINLNLISLSRVIGSPIY